MEQFEDNLDYLVGNSNLIGRDEEIEEILYRIASGSMLLIEGKEGTGKTSLLKHAIENFGGKGKVIYVDVGTFGKRFDVGNLLNEKSKDMILLIDNIQYLSEQNNEKIKYFYDQDYIKSVVFTVTNYNLVNFTEAIKSRVGRNIIKLKKLSKNDSLEIVKERLSNKYILSEEVLDQLHKSSTNVKELLVNCNSLCGYLDKKDRYRAKIEDVDRIASNHVEVKEVETCLECNRKLVEIGGYWRCANCDKFCGVCGALCDIKDSECPRCGLKIMEVKQ